MTISIPREERICERWNLHQLDDEYHLLFLCSAMNTIRQKFQKLLLDCPSLTQICNDETKVAPAYVAQCLDYINNTTNIPLS